MLKLYPKRKKGFTQTCLRAFGRQGRGKRKPACVPPAGRGAK